MFTRNEQIIYAYCRLHGNISFTMHEKQFDRIDISKTMIGNQIIHRVD